MGKGRGEGGEETAGGGVRLRGQESSGSGFSSKQNWVDLNVQDICH